VRLSNKVLSDNLEEFLNTSSMPQGDNSGLATYCMAKEISKEFRVVLGGDGGDELFGGYPTYTFPYLAERYSFIPRPVISWARRLASMVSDRQKYLSLPFKLQQLSLAWGKDIIKAHFSFKDFLPEKVAADILEQSFFKAGPTARYARSALERIYNTDSGCRDTVTKLCLTDFNTFLRSATIPKVERNCMRFSLENRLPYLDSRMLDLSIRTDPLLMVDKRETKKCLKSLLKKKAYGKISLNPIKQGFSPPLVAMFNKELGSWKDHWLNSKTPFFNSGLSKSLTKWQGQGWDLHRLQWNICVLSDWCSRNKII
jgi:asparagine synthase (glutamine-hydrolysing)